MRLKVYDATGLPKVGARRLWDPECSNGFSTADIGACHFPCGVANCAALPAATSISANIIRVVWFRAPPRGGTCDWLAFNVTTGQTGNYRLGLYRNVHVEGQYPGLLIYGSGSTAVGAGVNNVAPNVALVANEVYWVALNFDTANTCSICGTGQAQTAAMGIGSQSAGNANLTTFMQVAFTYAAYPTNFPRGATTQTGQFPLLFRGFSA